MYSGMGKELEGVVLVKTEQTKLFDIKIVECKLPF